MVKAVVLGAAGVCKSSLPSQSSSHSTGGIGQPLALLLKTNPRVTEVTPSPHPTPTKCDPSTSLAFLI
jgi:hypothetical protein